MNKQFSSVTIALIIGVLPGLAVDVPEGWFAPAGNHYVLLEEESVVLEGDASGEGSFSYYWDLGDGRQVEGQNPEVSYPQAGVYRVELIVENDQGERDPSPFCRWIFVNDPIVEIDDRYIAPFAFFNSPGQGEVFPVGEDIAFQGEGFDAQGDDVTLFWDFDDGTLDQGVKSVVKAYTESLRYFPKLFCRDDTGLTQAYPEYVTIYIYQDHRPPQGRVLSPEVNNPRWDAYEISASDTIALQGEVVGVENVTNYDAYWHVSGPDGWFFVDGFEPPLQQWSAHFYEAFFHVIDPAGIQDPIPDQISIWVRDDNRLPDQVTIHEPSYDLELDVSKGIDLSASARDIDGDEVRFEWSISDGRRFESAQVSHVRFSASGLYRISVTARDGHGGETTSRFRYVKVYDAASECDNPTARIQLLSPQAEQLSGPVGSTYAFAASTTNPQDGPFDYVWDFGNGQLGTGVRPANAVFSEPGWYPVRVFAGNGCNEWSGPKGWSVYIYGDNIPPEGHIIEPQPNVRDAYNRRVFAAPIGQSISFLGTATDVDGNLPLVTKWILDGEFVDSGLETSVVFDEPGRHEMTFLVFDAENERNPFPDKVVIRVIDPNVEPVAVIRLPDGDRTVEPGQPLSFEVTGRDPNELHLEYEWSFGTMAEPNTATGPWASNVTFLEESRPGQPYLVRVKARHPFSEQSQASVVRINVRRHSDQDFEPNNSIQQAAELQLGQYSQMSLDGYDTIDFFRFQVENRHRNLQLHLNSNQPSANMVLHHLDQGSWRIVSEARPSETGQTLTLQDANPGQYAIEISRTDWNKKDGLSYGIGLGTLQPALFLPLVVEDGQLQSSFGIINPTDEVADVNVIGLNEEGDRIASTSFHLDPHEKMFASSLEHFGIGPDEPFAHQIAWAQVQASHRLVGFATARSADQSQLMAVGGIPSLEEKLIVPHIADPNNGWYTRAVVVNATQQEKVIEFDDPVGDVQLGEETNANEQRDFRFADVYPDDLPQWGVFQTTDGTPALAGIELFGRKESTREIVGLILCNDHVENPNFLLLRNQLYFTHIAKDTTNWWTGIALVNHNQTSATCRLMGYNDQGDILAVIEDQILAAGEKFLATSDQLFGQAQVSWVKVESDIVLGGYELFGNPAHTRIAGFQAATALSDILFFPHLESDGWTGIALLNTSQSPIQLRVQAYDNAGQLLVENTRELAAQTKLVALANDLFDQELPENASYIQVNGSAKSLTGFELFGPEDSMEQLAGLAAVPF